MFNDKLAKLTLMYDRVRRLNNDYYVIDDKDGSWLFCIRNGSKQLICCVESITYVGNDGPDNSKIFLIHGTDSMYVAGTHEISVVRGSHFETFDTCVGRLLVWIGSGEIEIYNEEAECIYYADENFRNYFIEHKRILIDIGEVKRDTIQVFDLQKRYITHAIDRKTAVKMESMVTPLKQHNWE